MDASVNFIFSAVLSISQFMGDMVVESLKENPMLEASKEAEAIMEAGHQKYFLANLS